MEYVLALPSSVLSAVQKCDVLMDVPGYKALREEESSGGSAPKDQEKCSKRQNDIAE